VQLITTLDEISADDLRRTGGKAYNCARLKQAGFPVPDGIVVPADATEADLEQAARHPWLDAQPAGTRYAVRSSGLGEDSAGHSFAGIHETRLNVERTGLLDAILECRRSSASSQARAYRGARQLEDEGRIAVLVQRMVPAVTSGVAFTVNPITGAGEIVVNATRGLGEALVSGLIDPDEFILSKRDGAVISSRPATAAQATVGTSTVTNAQLTALGVLLLRIERHYGAPQDIEWCHDGHEFWILQSRPVTTAGAANVAGPAANDDAAEPTQHPALRTQHPEPRTQHPEPRTQHPEPRTQNPDTEWTRANLAEVLPEQMSPQVLAAYEVMLNKGQRLFMGRLLASDAELGPMFKAFHGRMYMNLSQMRRVTSLIGAPAADMLRSLGHPEQIHPDDEIPKRAPVRELLKCLPDFIRLGSYDPRIARILRQHEERTRRTMARIAAGDPRTLSDAEIWNQIEWWIAIAPVSIQPVFVMSGVLFREVAIRKACNQVGFPYERLVYTQLAAGKRSVSTQQAIELVALANTARHEPQAKKYLTESDASFADFRSALAGTAFLQRFERFLDQYGHRGRYESDWALPRLHENPAPALFAIQQQLHERPQDPRAVAERQEADAAGAWRAFGARLTRWQRWTLAPRIRAMLKRLKNQYVWREQVRSDLTRILRYSRAYHLTLAMRFVERGWIERPDDYFLVLLDEIGRAIAAPRQGPGLRDIAARRTAQLAEESRLTMPMLMRERDLPALLRAGRSEAESDSGELTGLCVSSGTVEAEVVVMRDPGEFASMRRGAILVAPATDPSWTPLFTLASGVIVEVGGMLSHASTIAREYGLPALANVKNATRILKSGERVRLDASEGRVTRLEG
jgi:rifampicin phosphotransferase